MVSLVNKVIGDLEERQVLGTGNAGRVFSGLSAANYEEKKTRLSNVKLLVFLLFLVASVSGTYAVIGKRDAEFIRSSIEEVVTVPVDAGDEEQLDAIKKQPVAPASLRLDFSLANPPTESMSSQLHPVSLNTRQTLIDKIELERLAGTLKLNLSISAESDFKAYPLSDPDRLVLHVNKASFTGQLPDVRGFENVSGIRIIDKPDGDFMLVLDLNSYHRVDDMELVRGKEGHRLALSLLPAYENTPTIEGLQLHDANEPPLAGRAEVAVFGEMKKQRRQRSNPGESEEMLASAKNLYKRGKVNEANNLLFDLLQINRRDYEARSLLARHLISQAQLQKAEYLLRQGLELKPGDSTWADLYARLLVNRGQVTEAIGILDDALPETGEQPSNHAFLAALYQKNDQHREAVRTYRRVLQFEPENGVWWMGLAISLESLGQGREALLAYRQALRGNAMSPDLQKYVHGKISYLGKSG